MTEEPGTEQPGSQQPRAHSSLSSGRRVAFFGGSFDPPHLGHLAVARAARDALRLDAVLFAPVGAQPLKPHGSTAPFADRLAMTRLAISGERGFEISLADAPNATGEPNFTLETLRLLRAALAPDGSLFCLMGADSFVSLRRWRGAAEIPFTASLIVASRPGQQLDDLARFLPSSLAIRPKTGEVIPSEPPPATSDERESHVRPELVESDLRVTRRASPTSQGPIPAPPQVELRSYVIRNPAGDVAPFYLLPDLDVEISASDIRNHVRSSDYDSAAVQSLLPSPVADYIRTYALYR